MWKEIPLKGYIYASLALNVISVVFVLSVKNYLPPVVPLFYGLPSGLGQLIPALGLIIAPTTGLLITGVNIVLTNFVKDLFFKKILIVSSLFVSVLVFITTVKIILLVGFF